MSLEKKAVHRCSVILGKPEELRFAELAHVYAQLEGIPDLDALHAAKVCWGIVAHGIERPAAERVAQALNDAGLSGKIIEDETMLTVSDRFEAVKFDISDTNLVVHRKTGSPDVIPWISVGSIVAAAIPETVTSIKKTEVGPSAAQRVATTGILLTTGIPLPHRKKQIIETKEEKHDFIFLADFVIDGSNTCYRMNAQNVDFSGLGMAMEYGVFANFRTFIAETARRAPQAYRGRGTRILLGNQLVSSMGYEFISDMEKEEQWLLTLRRLSGPAPK